MEFDQALNNCKWDILATLATGDYAATEIARKSGMSLPSISQQAKLLEAYGLIKQKKEKRDGPGKPKLIYGLGKEVAHIAVVRQGFAGKRTLPLDEFHEAVMNIWFYGKRDEHYHLQKLLWKNEELVERCKGIAVIESKGNEIHLLIITEKEHLDEIRKKFSKIEIATPDKQKKMMIAWTHTIDEVKEGLGRNEEYFRNLTKKLHVILERERIFKGIKEVEERFEDDG